MAALEQDMTMTQNQTPADDMVVPPTTQEAAEDSAGLLKTPEGQALAARLRKEEKDKLYDRLQRLESDRKALENEKAALLKSQQELEKQLKRTKDEEDSTRKGVQAQLADLRTELDTANAKVDVVMTEAAKMVKASELRAYREKRLAEEGVLLRDLVPADVENPEQIDRAIEVAKVKQQEIEDRARARFREELGQAVPAPLAPEQQAQSPIDHAGADPARRQQVARLPREEYERVRDELLKRAEQQTGWKRNRPTI